MTSGSDRQFEERAPPDDESPPKVRRLPLLPVTSQSDGAPGLGGRRAGPNLGDPGRGGDAGVCRRGHHGGRRSGGASVPIVTVVSVETTDTSPARSVAFAVTVRAPSGSRLEVIEYVVVVVVRLPIGVVPS